MKENKQTNLIVKNTAKIFKYNAGIDSVVEGNTVTHPFIAEYKGDRKTALEYIWFTKDENGNLHKRGIYVSGHGEYGVPTLFDYDVYVALQRIFLNKKTKNGVCELKTENLTDDDFNIEFTINELAKELDYKSPNNSVRENLKQSIRTLLATTIYSMHEGGIYDIRNKKYIINHELGYHYLEESEGFSIEDEDGNTQYDVTRIRLSRFTYYQILNDYKLFYDKKIYGKTKNKMAKKIYHMVLQWKGNKNFAWANINTIIEKIPMIEDEKKYQKRIIKKALKILNDQEMVKVTYGKDNQDMIYFNFSKKEHVENLLNKYNKYSEVKEALYDIGFSLIEVEEYIDIENIRFIQALLRYMDDHQPIPKPKKYFLKCYKERIDIDFSYYNEDSLIISD